LIILVLYFFNSSCKTFYYIVVDAKMIKLQLETYGMVISMGAFL